MYFYARRVQKLRTDPFVYERVLRHTASSRMNVFFPALCYGLTSNKLEPQVAVNFRQLEKTRKDITVRDLSVRNEKNISFDMRGANVFLYRIEVLTIRKRNSERPKFNISTKCHFSKQGQYFFTPAVCLPHLQFLCTQRVQHSGDYHNACITSPKQRQGTRL